MALGKLVFTFTKTLPDSERFGLVSQMNRAVVSVSSNIAEGSARKSDKHFIQFLETSLGSLFELETQLLLCVEFDYADLGSVESIIDKIHELQKMIYGFKKTLS